MKKRFLSILMAAAMVLSLLPASALAAEGATVTVAAGDDLVSAITGAGDGATITLSGDVTVSTPIVINKSLTLDLNGHTLIYSGTEKNAIAVQENDGITFAMRNGTLKVTDTTSNAQHAGVVVDWASGVTVDLDGVNIEMSGADNFASYYGVAVNGSSENGSLHVDLNGCTITGAGIGVYFPPVSDSLTIENSTISAWTAVVVKGGNVTISNSNLTGTEQEYDSSYYQSATYNNSGANTAGEALYLEGNYDRNVNIVLNGGTYTSEGNYAIRAQFLNSKYDHNIEIKDGIFTGKQGVIYEGHSSNTVCNTSYPNDAENAKAAISITGGTFSSDVSEYVTEGYIQDENGTVAQLGPDNAVAQVGDSYYATLSEAFSKASSGDTVKVLSNTDISGSKVVVSANKSLTLDLNGKEVQAVNNGNIFVSGKLTICDTSDGAQGTIRATQKYGGSNTGGIVVASGEDALLTMESGNIVASGFEDPKNNGQFGVMVQGGGDFTMTGGKIEAGWYAAAGNGNDETTNSVINIQGGELISTADYALYLPQSGTTTISGGTIRGAAGGISIQRGTLTIDNDNALITSLGTGDTGDWGDGTGGQDPAALNIAAEYGDTSVTISAGKFIAEQKDLFIKAPTEYTVALAITGGYYSNDPSEFLTTVDEKNYAAVADEQNFFHLSETP